MKRLKFFTEFQRDTETLTRRNFVVRICKIYQKIFLCSIISRTQQNVIIKNDCSRDRNYSVPTQIGGILSTEVERDCTMYIHTFEIVEEHFFHIFLSSQLSIRRMTNEGFLLDLLMVVRKPSDKKISEEKRFFTFLSGNGEEWW